MSNPASRTVSTNVSETQTTPKTSAFSRFFSRNGHSSSPAPETKLTGPPKSVWREYFESAVVTVIMALFGMTFVVQAVKVPTGSMQNTITIGDHLLVNKFIFAPGKTPAPIINRLNQEIVRFLNAPGVKERWFNAGVETLGSSPEQFLETIKADITKMSKVIKDAAIKIE